MKWVRVEDRLPELKENILIYDNNSCLVCLGWMHRDHGFSEEGRYIFNVSHWMPLPEPPK